MDAEQILQQIDELVFSHTGKHLNDLQQTILSKSLQNQKYPEIATQVHRNENYVKDTGGKLWKLLSDILGEDVNKFNIRSTFKKLIYKGVHSNNICRDIPPPPKNLNSPKKNTSKTQSELQEDLRDAPQLITFSGRREELTFLTTTILQQKTRLVGLFGVSGIGKTALALQLVNKIKHNFDYVIWRSLRSLPTLTEIQTDFIKLITKKSTVNLSNNQLFSQVKSYLHQHRCLIILDEVQLLFSKGKPAGTYLPGYENYGYFLKMIAEVPHNSCLLLTSWEQPREIELHNYCLSFPLTGLGKYGQEILKEKGLFGEENLEKLVDIYEAIPLYLEIVARIINNLFCGKVEEFLSYDKPFLDNDLKWILQQQIERLSPSEMNLLQLLAQPNNSISLSSLSEVEVSDIQSLKRRFLINTEEKNNQTSFYLDKVLKKYVKTSVYSKEKDN